MVIGSTSDKISKSISDINPAETGIILGSSVYKDQVSIIVKDRILTIVDLYKARKIKKILVSGDRSEKFYNEVSTIKKWLIKYGIAESDILLDDHGYSTYESIYRGAVKFHIKKTVVVSQCFHLPRAVYIARSKKMDAQGVCADRTKYDNIIWYQFREILARVKDFLYVHIIKPKA